MTAAVPARDAECPAAELAAAQAEFHRAQAHLEGATARWWNGYSWPELGVWALDRAMLWRDAAEARVAQARRAVQLARVRHD